MSIKAAIQDLKEELGGVKQMEISALAGKVKETCFKCKRCGKCCKGSYGDNTVSVFPREVRAIMNATGLQWLDIVEPPASTDVDEKGRFHTFEWVLRKKPDGDCIFLDDDGECCIYESRPFICRTYPMVLEDGRLDTCICDGLGTGTMSDMEAMDIATVLKERRVAELSEEISLFEQYKRFSPGRPDNTSKDKVYAVHDSEGVHMVLVRSDGTSKFL